MYNPSSIISTCAFQLSTFFPCSKKIQVVLLLSTSRKYIKFDEIEKVLFQQGDQQQGHFRKFPSASLSKASRCHTLWQKCTCRTRGFTNSQLETTTLGAHSEQAKATVQRRHEQIREQLSTKNWRKELVSTGERKMSKA